MTAVQGIVPVIPTPFTAEEEIDEGALRRLVEFAVECGVGAICLPAYGGEFYKLSEEERHRVVKIAVEQAAGRTLVIAQSNHDSARLAAGFARRNAALGADLISVAVPRRFALSNGELLHFLSTVLKAVEVPCLVQDFNPGGPTVGLDFISRLRDECPNFHYLKLEEPLLAEKIQTMRKALGDRVQILEGWGGLFMMELIPMGICGVMPGLGMADLLGKAFFLRQAGDTDAAFAVFEKVLPWIVFSLQNLELYLYCEKRLLQARGILPNAICRSAGFVPDPSTAEYVDLLNTRVIEAARHLRES
ncbi:MAG TPA: dihydrodipicolinate synthase family protein [Bryobacteraceae bacterium]|nr:dihydrodipicolinate synthase family protein [Bryobacteraceae bacterium]